MCGTVGTAQVIKDESEPNRATRFLGGLQANKALIIPVGNHNTLYPNLPMTGRVQINSTTGVFEYYDFNKWVPVGTGGGDGCGFSDEQCARLKALVYSNNFTAIGINPVYAERGVSTPVTISYNIGSGDDVITAASITQGIGSVLSKVNTGNISVSGGNRTDNLLYTLNITYTRDGESKSESKSAQFNTVLPQWAGTSSVPDFTGDYAALNNSGLTKYVLPTSQISREFTPTAQYDYFILSGGVGTITGNGFTYTIGEWGDNTTFFWKKAITLTLANGSTGTVYVVRTRELQNASITFTHGY